MVETIAVFDVWRLVNVALAVVALALLLARVWRRWGHWTPRLRMLTEALAGLLLSVVWGSVEQLLQHVEGGSRAAITTAACILTIWALTATDEKLER